MDKRHLETSLLGTLHSHARDAADEVFFTCDGRTLTYGQLWDSSGSLAAGLRESGIQSGDIVAAFAFNSCDMLSLMFACLRAGAVWAPLNVALGPDDLAYSVEAARAKVLLASAEMIERNARHLEPIARSLPLFQLDDAEPAAAWARRLPRPTAPTAWPAHAWEPGEFCWVIFSGATTGRPKPIALPQSCGIAGAIRVVDAVRFRAGDQFYSVLQMCHAWLLFYVIMPCLLSRVPCTAARWFSASQWLPDVRKSGATIVDAFLPMIHAIAAQPAQPDDADNPARLMIGGMGSAAERTADRLKAFEARFGLKTLNAYGLTEVGGLIAHETVETHKYDTSGKPHPLYEFMIADEDGYPLAQGEVGEILVRPRAPGLMALKYLGREDGTLHSWRDLWVHTSDLGRIDEEGFLQFLGRHAHWIRRKSENVSVQEVEDTIAAIAGVTACAVYGIPADLGDEDIVALVVLDATGPSLQDINATLADKLSYFKLPRYYERVDAVPRTVKGDVSRRELRERGLTSQAWDAAEANRKNRPQTSRAA